MYKVVFLDRSTIGPQVLLKKLSFQHSWEEYDKTKRDEVYSRALGKDIIVVNKVPVRRDVLEKLPELKMIAVAATGYNNIDVDCCKEKGVIVSNIRHYAGVGVPEHVFALVLSLRKQLFGYRKSVKNNEWQKQGQFCFFTHPIHNLAGKRLGIVGSGDLGMGTALLGKSFGMEVVFSLPKNGNIHSKPSKNGFDYIPFTEFIRTCDVISVHCPLTEDTKDLIMLKELKDMKNDCILINTARGGIVNEENLVQAIKEKIIGGAGIDVVSVEPPPDEHPYFSILGEDNFILTPHIAWASEETMAILSEQLITNIENFVAGNPSNVVII